MQRVGCREAHIFSGASKAWAVVVLEVMSAHILVQGLVKWSDRWLAARLMNLETRDIKMPPSLAWNSINKCRKR